MPSTVLSAATHGIDAIPVHVEVDTDRQLPSFDEGSIPHLCRAALGTQHAIRFPAGNL